MKSLIGTLLSHISLKPEDIFTVGVNHLLGASIAAKRDITQYIASKAGIAISDELFFETQVAGENRERPDLVAFNAQRQPVMIGEIKFWASLTDNQPIAYLKRLEASEYPGPRILFFLCPTMRLDTLWAELMRRCQAESLQPEIASCVAKYPGKNISLVLISNKEILSILEKSLINESNKMLLADLYQLRGLSEQIDEDAIAPLNEENFSPALGRQITQLYVLTDKVANKLKSETKASSDGLKATPQYAGYTRYLRFGNIGISLQLDFRKWYEAAETPFWLGLKKINPESTKWEFYPEIREKLKNYEHSTPKRLIVESENILIPLFAPLYQEEGAIVDDIYRQVQTVLTLLEDLS